MSRAALVEVLTGIYQYLPNTLTASMIVFGIFLGRISWILTAMGAIVLTIVVSLLQFGKGKIIPEFGMLPGAAAVAACSIVPSKALSFETIPSLWMATAFYYVTFILINAYNIYTTRSTKKTEALTVQHRKAVGIVSIVTTLILCAFLVIPRFIWSECESKYALGGILGAGIGVLMGLSWWILLNLCGPDVYPDVHGVMIGLRTGQPYST